LNGFWSSTSPHFLQKVIALSSKRFDRNMKISMGNGIWRGVLVDVSFWEVYLIFDCFIHLTFRDLTPHLEQSETDSAEMCFELTSPYLTRRHFTSFVLTWFHPFQFCLSLFHWRL
jgi:hypothetical protein